MIQPPSTRLCWKPTAAGLLPLLKLPGSTVHVVIAGNVAQHQSVMQAIS